MVEIDAFLLAIYCLQSSLRNIVAHFSERERPSFVSLSPLPDAHYSKTTAAKVFSNPVPWLLMPQSPSSSSSSSSSHAKKCHRNYDEGPSPSLPPSPSDPNRGRRRSKHPSSPLSAAVGYGSVISRDGKTDAFSRIFAPLPGKERNNHYSSEGRGQQRAFVPPLHPPKSSVLAQFSQLGRSTEMATKTAKPGMKTGFFGQDLRSSANQA